MGTNWSDVAKKLTHALHSGGDGGATITEAERASLARAYPDVEADFLDRTTAFLNHIDEGCHFSRDDVVALTKEFPAEAANLLAALKAPSLHAGSFRLFTKAADDSLNLDTRTGQILFSRSMPRPSR